MKTLFKPSKCFIEQDGNYKELTFLELFKMIRPLYRKIEMDDRYWDWVMKGWREKKKSVDVITYIFEVFGKKI